jgi:foldase protein PrsA
MTRAAILMVTGALLLAACGGDSVAATVNDTEITTADVEGLLYEVSDFDRTSQQFAIYLGVTIQWEAIDQRVAEEFGFEPSEEEIDAEVRRLVIDAGFLDIPSYLVQQNISEAALRRIASQIVIEQHLHELFGPDVEAPDDEEVQQEIDESPERWVDEVCASHILVATVEEAEAALVRLDAGESFSDLAAELSIDTSNAEAGGSLGCADPIGYVPEFATATATEPIGEVAGPVETQFGAHLILIESRELTPFEEVRDALKELRTVDAVSDWLTAAVKMAAITVDESRGTWVTEPEPFVQPPPELG